MKNKYIQTLQKLCATIISVCFTVTIITNNSFSAVNPETAKAQQPYFESKDKTNSDYLFPSKYGKIISYNDNFSDTVIINIQDLHCDYSVQKNISEILGEISKKYNIEKVYVEGGIGNIDTSLLANINSQYKQNILGKLLKSGKLTGTEYYSAINNKTSLLKGVEDKEIYDRNIQRLSNVLNSKKETERILENISREIDFLKSKYLNSENKKFSKLLQEYETGKIKQKQWVYKLTEYARNNKINLNNYPNLNMYLTVIGGEFNGKKVQKELTSLLTEIKKSVSYVQYQTFIKVTQNLTNITKLRIFTEEFCENQNINLQKKYPNLAQYFILKEKSLKYNPVQLVQEERKLMDVLRTYLSETDTELEISYLSDFENFYKGYITASLTESQWKYVKIGLDKFKELYAKYSIQNDIEKLEKYSNILNEFYAVNTERNRIFIKNMKLSINSSITSDYSSISSSNPQNILSKAKNVVVLVAGGYHTDGITEILNEKNISNITITPNISNLTKNSRAQYEYLAQQQVMSVKQMIALGLISNASEKEQILTIINSLMPNRSLDGVDINMLVQQLNQIFFQYITVSLITDEKKLEFTLQDGSKYSLNIDDDLISIIEEQNRKSFAEEFLIRREGEDLKEIVNLVSKATFNYGTGIFAPQIYQISKDVCLFMVNNKRHVKWYLGNGAVWEIANSEYSGQTLDGVEPIVYEYMPDIMQKALLEKQRKNHRNKRHNLKDTFSNMKKAILYVFLGIVSIAVISCGIIKYKISNTVNQKIYEPYKIVSIELSDSQKEFNTEIKNIAKQYYAGNGAYKSFIYNLINDKLPGTAASGDDRYALINIENLYDQALVALSYMQVGDIDKASEILSAIDARGNLAQSNLETRKKTGESVWVGIAAVQYKLLTGDDRFDHLIGLVDSYLNRVRRSGGCYYGELTNNYVSTEHMLDIIAYFNLKSLLYTDVESAEAKDNIRRLNEAIEFVYSDLYVPETGSFKRGRNDNFQALDTYSWGVQVIHSLRTVNPEIYDNSSFSKIDLNKLLTYAEQNFAANFEYKGTKYQNLYRWSDEKDSPISFEWSMQMAISYKILGNDNKAEAIMKEVEKYSKAIMKDVEKDSNALGFGTQIPYSNMNGVYNYTANGWKVFAVPAVCTTVGQRVQYEYGTFFLPITRTGENETYTVDDEENSQRLYFVKQQGANWRTYGAQETVNLMYAKTIEFDLELLNAKDVPDAKVQLQLLTADPNSRQNLEGSSFGLYNKKYSFDSNGKLTINLDMRDFLGTDNYEPPPMITTNLEYIKLILIAGETSFEEDLNSKKLDIDIKKVTITYTDGTKKVYTLTGRPKITGENLSSDISSAILPKTISSINDLISGKSFSIIKALAKIVDKETFKSLFTPIKYIENHINPAGATILTIVTVIALFAMFLTSMSLLSGAYVPIVQVALSAAAAFLAAFDVNVGTHAIIDYRFLKSIGLSEAIKLYGKDDVRLTESGNISIDNKEQTVPIYVINDKPKNAKDFNFKSVPIKVKAKDGKYVKCWIGNYNNAAILFADGADYEVIVKEFGKTRQFETIYGKKTALRANVDVIEIDMNNPKIGLSYSQSGNVMIGADMVRTGDIVDLQKEISLLRNKRVETVTINQNVAVYIDDELENISSSQDFMDVINLYMNNNDLGVNAKILFNDKFFTGDKVTGRKGFLELLEQEYGSSEAAEKEFIRIIEQLKQENKEIVVVFDENEGVTSLNKYKQYGIFSYIANNEYVDGLTQSKSQIKFVTNLNQIFGFDGSLSIIKVSAFKEELAKSSGIFTFLTSSLNLKEYIKTRNVNFVKQVANNFDFDQIPVIDIEQIAQILTDSENKFKDLSEYLNGSDSISIYYLGLTDDEQRDAFMEEILKRALVVNYLRNYEYDKAYGLKDKTLEDTLAKALIEKYKSDKTFNVVSDKTLDESVSMSQLQFNLLQEISELSQKAFVQETEQNKENKTKAIDDIIKLIPLYAEPNIRLRTANAEMIDIKSVKGILSAA